MPESEMRCPLAGGRRDSRAERGGPAGGHPGDSGLRERERFTTTRWPLLLRPPGDGGQTGVAGISTTPAQPPAPSGLRSKGHMVVVDISRSRKAPCFARPRPSAEAGASEGVENRQPFIPPPRVGAEDGASEGFDGRQPLQQLPFFHGVDDGFKPMQPIMQPPEHLLVKPKPPMGPPPVHLRRELTPKIGSGLAKHMGSPPAKRGRYE